MNTVPETAEKGLDRAFSGLREAREAFSPQLTLREIGTVRNVSVGIATVSGLPGVSCPFEGPSQSRIIARRAQLDTLVTSAPMVLASSTFRSAHFALHRMSGVSLRL